MKTRTSNHFHKPYHHGPRIRYFVEAMTVGLFIGILLVIGIALIIQLIFPE